MEILGKRKRKKYDDEELYPTCYQLYLYPPKEDIPLEEFEKLATLRQKVLHEIGNAKERSRRGDLKEKDYKAQLSHKLKDWLPLESHLSDDRENPTLPARIRKLEANVEKHLSQRRDDHISHYILRLAYCRSEELRRLFLAQEVELMRFRLLYGPPEEREEMILQYRKHLPLKGVVIPTVAELKKRKGPGKVASEEDKLLSEEMEKVYSRMTIKEEEHSDDDEEHSGEDENEPDSSSPQNKPGLAQLTAQQTVKEFCMYQVNFTEVLDLVQHREVIIKGGYAYLPCNNYKMVVSYICNKFRSLLSQDLVRMVGHVLSVVDQDERVTPLLKSMRYKYTGADFSAGSDVGEKISLRHLDALSRESFAPCMRHLHETLRKEHHLRHFGRLQYGLFLKSINLTLDQALAFWKEEFTKKMEPEKFDKQYAYNVRHSYGKEGKRANYTPYSCMKIIMSNAPGPGDHHGCPFRHWDKDHIQEMLSNYGVAHKSVLEIMDYVESSHYQLACQKYFDVAHRLEQSVFSLEHPSQYFFESRKLRKGQQQQQPSKAAKVHDDGDDSDIKMSADDMKAFECEDGFNNAVNEGDTTSTNQ